MADIIYSLTGTAGKLVWGPATIVLLCFTGLYLSLRTGFFQLRLNLVFKNTLLSLKEDSKAAGKGISPFASMSAALGGTLGTGNIAGVATAIAAGGPGAVFWMWISAFLGMITKYAEVLLACVFRNRNEKGEFYGGPMYYMKNGLNLKVLPIVFSLFCALASFGTGNMAQTNAVSLSMKDAFGVSEVLSGIITAAVTAAVISGGMKRITGFTEKLIPLFGLAYTAGAITVLIVNITSIPEVFSLIFKSAFNVNSIGGGTAGYVMSNAVRYGVSRGIFSNEAGLGSAPIAHAAANFSSPVKQAMWGIFEVFFDTVVMCTLTAFVILSTGVLDSGLNGISLTAEGFSCVFGGISKGVLAVFTVFFAIASIICWAYYGETAVNYLFKNSKIAAFVYRSVFVAVTFVGSISPVDFVFEASDLLNGLMALPNIASVLLLSPVVIRYTKSYRRRTPAARP